MNIKRYRYFAVNRSTKTKIVANFAYLSNSFRNNLIFFSSIEQKLPITVSNQKKKSYNNMFIMIFCTIKTKNKTNANNKQ